MSEMVERVAREILKALDGEAVFARACDDDLARCEVDGGLFDMRIIARAAIEVMREPTEAMVDAATMTRGGRQTVGEANRATWQAMIDAALA